jgi:hypothetical protein
MIVGIHHADDMAPFYLQKLAPTSSTSGTTTEFVLFWVCVCLQASFSDFLSQDAFYRKKSNFPNGIWKHNKRQLELKHKGLLFTNNKIICNFE